MTLKTIEKYEAFFGIEESDFVKVVDVINLIDEYFEKKKSFVQNNFITKKFNSFQMEEALEEIEEELKARINGK